MSERLIDWFDEHGRKTFELWEKRWVQGDDFIPPPAPEDGPGVPVFDLSNVVKLMDESGGPPILEGFRKVEEAIGRNPLDLARDAERFAEAARSHAEKRRVELDALIKQFEDADESGDAERIAAADAALEAWHAGAAEREVEDAKYREDSAMADYQAASDLAWREAFPNVRPPYRGFWAEWAVSDADFTAQTGWGVNVVDHEFLAEGGRPDLCDPGVLRLVAKCYIRVLGDHPGPVEWGGVLIDLTEDGAITHLKWTSIGGEKLSRRAAAQVAHVNVMEHLNVLLLGLSLMNARNIAQVAERPQRQTKKRQQRGLPPQRELRVLRLNGKYTARDDTAGTGEPGRSPRRHTYRGHWREYGMKPGQGLLFGKYRCRCWVPDGQRGIADIGVIDKRYVVVPWPKGSP